MKHTYCSDCGAKIEYSLKIPNFCSSCGNSLNSSSNTISRAQAPVNQENDPEDIQSFKKPVRLEYEVSHSSAKKISLKELIDQGPVSQSERIHRPKNIKPIDSEQIINEGIRECSSSRPTDIGE